MAGLGAAAMASAKEIFLDCPAQSPSGQAPEARLRRRKNRKPGNAPPAPAGSAIADSVNDVVTPAPGHSRALDVPTIGALVIALEPTRQIVLQVVRLADTWLRNRPARRVELEIDGEKIKMEGLGSRDIREITTKLMEVYARNSDKAVGQGKGIEDET